MARSLANERDSFVGRQTLGGGTGKYRNACGDVPHCLIRGSPVAASTPDTTEAKLDAACMPMRATNILNGGGQCEQKKFVVLEKNCRGLKNADRFDELMKEAENTWWDLLLLNETCREQVKEKWKSEQGHIFAGCGHISGRKGVAIVLHSRWQSYLSAFNAINERICSMDFTAFGTKIRAISVYFPDSTYQDEEVQKVYEHIAEEAKLAKKQGRNILLAGDFNASASRRRYMLCTRQLVRMVMVSRTAVDSGCWLGLRHSV